MKKIESKSKNDVRSNNCNIFNLNIYKCLIYLLAKITSLALLT